MSWEPLDDAAERTTDDTALFHRTLAELCRAEVPLGRALRVVGGQLDRGPLSVAAGRMAERVDAGHTLGEAYAQEDAHFEATYRRLIDAAEGAGDLPTALEDIARHAARQAEAAQRMRRAIAYPLVTALFVLLIGVGTVAFLSPTLFRYTTVVSGSSPIPVVIGVLLVLGALVGTTFYAGWVRSGPKGARAFGLPLSGSIRRNASRARVAATLSMLLRREVPLPEAFAIAAQSTDNPDLRRRLAATAADAEGGGGLVPALREGAVFEPTLLWLVETGEQGGGAADALADIAAIYRQRLARGIDRFSVLVRPAAELVVGVFVFVMAYAFIVPVYDSVFNLF